MTRVEHILGHESDAHWQDETQGDVQGLRVDTLELSQWDAQKTRLRKKSSADEDVVIALDRDTALRDGDILACDDTRILVCRIALCEVMVVHLQPDPPAASDGKPSLMERCLQLGHALGNQHWPAVVSHGHIYVPLSVDRRVMDSVMRTHSFPGVSYIFRPGADVLAELSQTEARRLFGGAEQPDMGAAGRHHHHTTAQAEHAAHSHAHSHGHDHHGHHPHTHATQGD